MWSPRAEGGTIGFMEQAEPHDDIPRHRPAMLAEVLDLLSPQPTDRALDLTLGTGGHALAVGRRLGQDGLLVGIDADRKALEVARKRLAPALSCPLRLFHCRFSEAPDVVRELGVKGFETILADLGVGTHQLDDPSRGFSFSSESRLDMRFDPSGGTTAWEVVNRTPQRELADIFYNLGEERLSRQIAAAICGERQRHPIDTPAQLSALIKRVAARRSAGRTWRIHPATRTAMALRMLVNDEMGELERLLEILPSLLAPGGRAVVITYHSLEARRVKQTWRRQHREGVLELMTARPIRPAAEEVRENPRVRSAQLRAARKP